MTVTATTAYAPASEALDLVRALLADLDITQRAFLTPTGAVRASNVATFTTTLPHGLVPQDVVNVQAVDDPTFNGKYNVVDVPTSTTFTVSNPGADVSSGHGFLDQLSQGDVYTDTVLFPFLKLAYRTVQRELLGDGSKTMTKEIILENFAADATVLNDSTDPALPGDFLGPRELWERQAGTTTFFREMAPCNALPERPEAQYNCQFSWRQDAIYFVGATQATDIRLRYYAAMDDLENTDSLILIRGGLDPVTYKCALLAAGSRSSTLLALWSQEYQSAIGLVKDLQEHARQYLPSRRRPYGGRRNSYNRGAWY